MLRPILAAASGSYGLFYTLLVLHVAAALTGFASIGFAGTYAGRATHFATVTDRSGPVTDLPGEATDLPGEATDLPGEVADEASSAAPAGMTTEELVRYFRRPAGLWWALLAVPWLGLGALAAEPHGGGVAQAWDLAAFGLWVAAALVAALAVVPNLHRVGAALVLPAAGPPGPGWAGLDGAARARVARCGLVASRGAAVCDVLFLMALALMIWQP
jgi:hypothetical protein